MVMVIAPLAYFSGWYLIIVVERNEPVVALILV